LIYATVWIFCALEVLGTAHIGGQNSCRDNVRLRDEKFLKVWGDAIDQIHMDSKDQIKENE
jgi:hypothetical protein